MSKSNDIRTGMNNADRDRTLVNMMGGVAFLAAVIIGVRLQSWWAGLAVFVVLFASTYLRGHLATLAALIVGAGCAWAGGLLGSAVGNDAAVVAAIVGFVIGAGAHVGAQRYMQDTTTTQDANE